MKKVILKILSSLALLFSFYSLLAQGTETRFATMKDVTIDSAVNKSVMRSCNSYQSYIPDTLNPELTPPRIVRINLHVIQDAKGGHNFSEEEGKRFIHNLVNNANERLASNKKMNLPENNNTPVLPIPYRYVLTGDSTVPGDDGIYFHRDDTLFYMNKKAKSKNNVYDVRQFEKYGVQKNKVINIFMIEHDPDSVNSPTYKVSSDGVGPGPWAKLAGTYYLHNHPNVTPKGDTIRFEYWNLSGLLNHELGHCFSLSHTWNQSDGCDDTPMNSGCWNFGPPPCNVVSNNVMDYNAYQNAFTPCQIGKMCMSFYNDNGARRFIVPDWCNYDKNKSITIRNGETVEWPGSMDVRGDLVVGNNATLTLHCTLSMAPGAKIILMPKATLILDGCTLTSRCSNEWEGIEINTNKKSQPVIIMKNRSKVQNIAHPL